ncbi:MAG: YchJ family protein [Sulfuricellaceae bacterium]
MKTPSHPLCPCDSGKPFSACCARYLAGEMPAPTAETLMRSRYCAYTRRDEAYLLRTWHPTTRPDCLALAEDDGLRWLGLKVLKCVAGEDGDSDGTVEFVARFKRAGKGGRMHEISRFVREQGCWYYLDGETG